jgi:hypothetical protein
MALTRSINRLELATIQQSLVESGPDREALMALSQRKMNALGIPLAYVGGLVWGARPDQLWAIDPASNTVTRRIALSDVDEILALDVDTDAGEAWLAVRRPGGVGTVIAVDLATEAVTSDTKVPLPAGIRIAPDRVWVTDYESGQLIGIARG